MRKLMLILLVAVMTAPAMATVTISIADNGDINYVCDGDDADGVYALMAGVAIIVTVDAGDAITVVDPEIDGESTEADPGYGVFMKTAQIGGDPLDWVTGTSPVATPDSPGEVGGIGENQITLEFGALYALDTDAPLASGRLCTITIGDGSTNATLALEDVARGGIVMEGGAAPSDVILIGGPISPDDPGCDGDFDGSNMVNSGDVSVIVNYWLENKNFFGNAPDHPDYDLNCDDQVNSGDVSLLVNYWLEYKNFFGNVVCPGPGFIPTCP